MGNRLLLVLSEDPADIADVEAYAAWNESHLRVMAGLPGIVSAQGFRIDSAFEALLGERPETPRYRHINVFEVEEGFAGPRPGTEIPDQPGGTGPNRPAPFLFVATTERLAAN